MNKNVKLLISFALVGIVIPFASAIFCKVMKIGDEISVAILTAISTVIVVAIENLPKIIKVKKGNSKNKINHIETKMRGVEAKENIVVGNYITGEIPPNSYSKKVENKKTELGNVRAGKNVVAGDYISKEQ